MPIIFYIIFYLVSIILFVYMVRIIEKDDIEHDWENSREEGLTPIWQLILMGMIFFWAVPALAISSRPWHHPGGY